MELVRRALKFQKQINKLQFATIIGTKDKVDIKDLSCNFEKD